jgi:hypothetical protein
MSHLYQITAAVGTTIIGQDVLFPTSHPKSSSRWSNNPNYGSVSMVPLKIGVLDAFRKNAEQINAEPDIGRDIAQLEYDVKSQREALNRFDSFRALIE